MFFKVLHIIFNNLNLIFADFQNNEFSSGNPISRLSGLINLKYLDLSWNYLEEFSIRNESLKFSQNSHDDLKSIDTYGAINLQLVRVSLKLGMLK